MATDPGFAAYVLEQAQGAGDVVVKRMFGEYGLYVDGTFVGVLCDDQCFLKPTDAVRAQLGDPVEAAPYPSAKPHFLLGAELEDPARFAALLRATAAALPAPAPKRPSGRAKARAGGRSGGR